MRNRGSAAAGAGLALVLGCAPATVTPAQPIVEVTPPAPTASGPLRSTQAAAANPTSSQPTRHPGPTTSALAPSKPPLDFGRCLRWRMCEYEGLCSPTAQGGCVALRDDDCAPSDACLGGRCSARNGRCVATSDRECRASLACTSWGRCSFDGRDACMASTAADCLASARCRREGECALQDGVCVKPPPIP